MYTVISVAVLRIIYHLNNYLVSHGYILGSDPLFKKKKKRSVISDNQYYWPIPTAWEKKTNMNKTSMYVKLCSNQCPQQNVQNLVLYHAIYITVENYSSGNVHIY